MKNYVSFHYWMIENIKKGSTILELGSGPGTNILLDHFKVYSVEHNAKWVNYTKSNYIHAPIRKYNNASGSPYNWYDIDVLKRELPNTYDFILVDGPTGKIGRMGFFHNLNLFDMNVKMIIDDVNRKNDMNLLLKVSNKLKRPSVILNQKDKKFGVL